MPRQLGGERPGPIGLELGEGAHAGERAAPGRAQRGRHGVGRHRRAALQGQQGVERDRDVVGPRRRGPGDREPHEGHALARLGLARAPLILEHQAVAVLEPVRRALHRPVGDRRAAPLLGRRRSVGIDRRRRRRRGRCALGRGGGGAAAGQEQRGREQRKRIRAPSHRTAVTFVVWVTVTGTGWGVNEPERLSELLSCHSPPR